MVHKKQEKENDLLKYIVKTQLKFFFVTLLGISRSEGSVNAQLKQFLALIQS